MKVFISCSGQQCRKFGEALQDWLPQVLDPVKPYLAPADIDKESRWSNDISKELAASRFAILCVTRESIQSNWLHFEAGALSESLEKSHVCPILFGIKGTDLTGPLNHLRTRAFNHGNMLKLLGTMNNRLRKRQVSQKTLIDAFERLWPDLKTKIGTILSETEEPDEPMRSDRELLEEVLQLSRVSMRRLTDSSRTISAAAITNLLIHYIEIHESRSAAMSSREEVLGLLHKLHPAVEHIASRFLGDSDDLRFLFQRFQELTYSDKHEDSWDDIPF